MVILPLSWPLIRAVITDPAGAGVPVSVTVPQNSAGGCEPVGVGVGIVGVGDIVGKVVGVVVGGDVVGEVVGVVVVGAVVGEVVGVVVGVCVGIAFTVI